MPATAARLIRLLRPPGADGPGIFCITSKRQPTYYVFQEIPCEIGGRGFVVHRIGLANLYHIRVGAASHSSCECLGYLRHNQCKHLLGLQTLIERQLI